MPITPHNLVRHELCGLNARVKDSTDASQKGLSGEVTGETYSTVKIEAKDGKEKVIPKGNTVFIFTLPNKVKVMVDGKVLIGRPEDRIKKKIARW